MRKPVPVLIPPRFQSTAISFRAILPTFFMLWLRENEDTCSRPWEHKTHSWPRCSAAYAPLRQAKGWGDPCPQHPGALPEHPVSFQQLCPHHLTQFLPPSSHEKHPSMGSLRTLRAMLLKNKNVSEHIHSLRPRNIFYCNSEHSATHRLTKDWSGKEDIFQLYLVFSKMKKSREYSPSTIFSGNTNL